MESSLWALKHQPTVEEALVVQKKKVAELRELLAVGTRRLIVLQGPAGSGKSTTLRCICRGLGIEVVEWSGAARQNQSSAFRGESHSDAFLRFLADAGGMIRGRRRAVLVRDVPYTLLDPMDDGRRQPVDVLERLRALLQNGAMHCVIFCFNEALEDHRAVKRLRTQVDPSLAVVHFLGVAATFAQKALDSLLRAENLDPGVVNLPAIAADCGGDLRHAINALQLAAAGLASRQLLECDLSQPTTLRIAPLARKRGAKAPRLAASQQVTASPPPPPQGGLRLASLDFFHALGRLLYNKRIPPPSKEAAYDVAGLQNEAGSVGAGPLVKRRKKGGEDEPRQLPPEMLIPKSSRPPLYFVPEDVLESSGAEPANSIGWLFTNAPRHYGDICDLAELAETIALVDTWDGRDRQFRSQQEIMNEKWRTLPAAVCARAILDANLHPVQPSFGDPAAVPGEGNSSSSFAMVRPVLLDVEQQRQRRVASVNSSLEAIVPLFLGSQSASTPMMLRTLPFCDRLLCYTRGQHASLRRLPYSLQGTIQELSTYDGRFLTRRASVADEPSADAPVEAWAATGLGDDPIEGF